MSMKPRDVIASFVFAGALTVAVAVTEFTDTPVPLRWLSLPGFAAVAWIPGFGVHGTSAAAVITASFFVYFVAATVVCWFLRRWRADRHQTSFR